MAETQLCKTCVDLHKEQRDAHEAYTKYIPAGPLNDGDVAPIDFNQLKSATDRIIDVRDAIHDHYAVHGWHTH